MKTIFTSEKHTLNYIFNEKSAKEKREEVLGGYKEAKKECKMVWRWHNVLFAIMLLMLASVFVLAYVKHIQQIASVTYGIFLIIDGVILSGLFLIYGVVGEKGLFLSGLREYDLFDIPVQFLELTEKSEYIENMHVIVNNKQASLFVFHDGKMTKIDNLNVREDENITDAVLDIDNSVYVVPATVAL